MFHFYHHLVGGAVQETYRFSEERDDALTLNIIIDLMQNMKDKLGEDGLVECSCEGDYDGLPFVKFTHGFGLNKNALN